MDNNDYVNIEITTYCHCHKRSEPYMYIFNLQNRFIFVKIISNHDIPPRIVFDDKIFEYVAAKVMMQCN